MLKKDQEVKWNTKSKEAFQKIKEAISSTPVLRLNYLKNFHIFSFAFEDIIVVVLLQKNNQNMEKPITFMSKTIGGVELGYSIPEKQAYALVQSLKHFKRCIGHSKVIAFLPHPAIKDIVVQHDCLDRRGKWFFKI